MSKKIVIELTQSEAKTLADSIGDHVSDMHDLYGCDLDEVESMAGAKKILDSLTDIRLKVLTALSKDKRQSVIEWHKYPDEKPKRKGYYYIKFKDDPRICEILLDENDTILEDGEYWAEPPKFPSED
jgi:hypothetical protein